MHCIDHFGAQQVIQQHLPVAVVNAQRPQRGGDTEQGQAAFVGVERGRQRRRIEVQTEAVAVGPLKRASSQFDVSCIERGVKAVDETSRTSRP